MRPVGYVLRTSFSLKAGCAPLSRYSLLQVTVSIRIFASFFTHFLYQVAVKQVGAGSPRPCSD